MKTPIGFPDCPALRRRLPAATACAVLIACAGARAAGAQLTDVTQTPNPLNAGIQKSLEEEIGAGRGDQLTPGSSIYLIGRDPFRAIARGRQLFQRKFTRAQGNGPRRDDGIGNIAAVGALGAGLADSCAACHSRPFGSAGFGGNVFTRPDSRDAPHLFGLGLVEILADEITQDLRALRDQALRAARSQGSAVALPLVGKGLSFGALTVYPDGTQDASQVRGVDADLRVRPFFAEGRTLSIREFVVGAFDAEMGLQAFDPDLLAAAQGQDVVTPAGMVLSGSRDRIEAPPARAAWEDPDGDGVVDEVPASLVDFTEFYLLNYFEPGLGRQTSRSRNGYRVFGQIGCAECHVPSLEIERDRRVAAVHTAYDEAASNRVFNSLFARAELKHDSVDDDTGLPTLKPPLARGYTVNGIFADFRRHDLGPAFHERDFDGTLRTEFMTEPLWGVASTPPYGHDGRSATLTDVILRHGGEARPAREGFAALGEPERADLLAFLDTLVLFSPPDTASNLAPADPSDPQFPIHGHGSIDLSVLFEQPAEKE